MNIVITRVREAMSTMKVPLDQRSKYLAIAVAKAAAYAQPLPTSRLDSPVTHYNQVVLPDVQNTVSAINEFHILDVPVAMTLALKIWLIRYRIAHEPTFVTTNELLNNIAAVDRVSLGGLYGESFTSENAAKVDRLVGELGKDLEASFNFNPK